MIAARVRQMRQGDRADREPSINVREGSQAQAAGRILAMWFGKLLSMAGVILLVLAVSPMGDFWDPRKSSLANTWRWIRNPRPDLATAVTVDPRFLCGGALCAIIGILWS
jgi:hypothetical protein